MTDRCIYCGSTAKRIEETPRYGDGETYVRVICDSHLCRKTQRLVVPSDAARLTAAAVDHPVNNIIRGRAFADALRESVLRDARKHEPAVPQFVFDALFSRDVAPSADELAKGEMIVPAGSVDVELIETEKTDGLDDAERALSIAEAAAGVVTMEVPTLALSAADAALVSGDPELRPRLLDAAMLGSPPIGVNFDDSFEESVVFYIDGLALREMGKTIELSLDWLRFRADQEGEGVVWEARIGSARWPDVARFTCRDSCGNAKLVFCVGDRFAEALERDGTFKLLITRRSTSPLDTLVGDACLRTATLRPAPLPLGDYYRNGTAREALPSVGARYKHATFAREWSVERVSGKMTSPSSTTSSSASSKHTTATCRAAR